MSRLFVANWKMNSTRAAAKSWAAALGARIGARAPESDLVVSPPYTVLAEAADPRGRWSLGAQNVSQHRDGAYTGEVSAAMLADAGCRFVIVGHSERRRHFGDTGSVLAAKLARAREAGLVPIYCVGETEEERAEGLQSEVLAAQMEALLEEAADAPLVVAYEPVWAIGTGRAATSGDAARARETLAGLLDGRAGVRILYGGSVTRANAAELLAGSGMDGFLVGGASLDPDSFAAIAGIGGIGGAGRP
ncbi:MAG: triose-phosphate isomerase [Acidobacteriota bacterium]